MLPLGDAAAMKAMPAEIQIRRLCDTVANRLKADATVKILLNLGL